MNYSEIRAEARKTLQGNWNKLAGIMFVYYLFMLVPGIIVNVLIVNGLNQVVGLIIGGPFALSMAMMFLKIYHGQMFEFGDLFKGFSSYSRSFMANLLVTIYALLWTLLLIVPGIIASIKYSQVFFIMAEDPDISASDAITLSTNMMGGHKNDYVVMNLAFLGWALLCILTLGIGFLWLGPYMAMTQTLFYKKVQAAYQQKQFAISNES